MDLSKASCARGPPTESIVLRITSATTAVAQAIMRMPALVFDVPSHSIFRPEAIIFSPGAEGNRGFLHPCFLYNNHSNGRRGNS